MLNFPESHAGLELILAHIIQDFMRYMRQSGLSSPQINALLHIYHSGECQVTDIGLLADSSKSAASQLVDRLVQQGLVERTEDVDDRRIKKLRLTEQGHRLIQEGVNSNHFLIELMNNLPEDQRKIIQQAFAYLAQAGQQLKDSHKAKEQNDA